MARNVSVQRFKALTESLKQEVRALSISEVNAQADQLVDLMKSVAPVGVTGKLKESIRKEPGKTETQVVIKAGGPLTTKEVRAGSAVPYDYARAEEFGVHGRPGTGFFFGTYRLRKKKIRQSVKRKLVAAVKKRSAQ